MGNYSPTGTISDGRNEKDEKTKQVDRELGQLSMVSHRILEKVHFLVDDLSPVLSEPTPERPRENKEILKLVPLEEEIRNKRLLFEEIENLLIDIHDRLEI